MALFNVGRIIESVFGFDKEGVGRLRSIEWGKKYLWECKFVDETPPDPFVEFFPAGSISVNTYSLESKPIEGPMSTYKIPLNTSDFSIKMEFYDDINNTLLNWFNDWVNKKILNNGAFISTLEDSVRLLHVTRLDASRNPIVRDDGNVDTWGYWVYPESDLEWEGTSTSDVPIYSVTLVIAGIVPPDGPPPATSLLDEVIEFARGFIGRFL